MSREEEEEEVRLKFNLYPPRFRGGSQAYTGLGVSHRELYIVKTRIHTHPAHPPVRNRPTVELKEPLHVRAKQGEH